MDQGRDAGHHQAHEDRQRVDQDRRARCRGRRRSRRSQSESTSWRSSSGWSSSSSSAPIDAEEGERDRARCRSSPAARPGSTRQPSAITIAAREREGEDQPAVGGGAHPAQLPASRRRRAAAGGGTSRRSGRGRPPPRRRRRPSRSARTPARPALPCMREKATSARLPAFSISSRQSRTTSGLRRDQHARRRRSRRCSAERTRYQAMSMPDLERLAALDVGARGDPRRPAAVLGRAPASTTAPTAATSSSSEAASNGDQEVARAAARRSRRAAEAGADVGALGSSAFRPGRGPRSRARRTAPRRTAAPSAAAAPAIGAAVGSSAPPT